MSPRPYRVKGRGLLDLFAVLLVVALLGVTYCMGTPRPDLDDGVTVGASPPPASASPTATTPG